MLALASIWSAAPAQAARTEAPEWVKPALRYLVDGGHIARKSFKPNEPMTRAAFTDLMGSVFGGGYSKMSGEVTAAEVSAALVEVLGADSIAKELKQAESPDGWSPGVGRRFGSEVVARELGLRHDRPTTEDANEASASESMAQADVIYAVWKAKVDPDTYVLPALDDFELSNYTEAQRGVVEFALSLVGTPYVWGGEWLDPTPTGYPYGAQEHGGVDCSGFAWYVLREASSNWAPVGRSYEGWELPERSSSQMAAATPKRKRLNYKELQPGDLVFFAPGGKEANASSVYHVGIYLGEGWMVHSSGSRAGISLGEIGPGAWWHSQLAWGRRVIN